MILNVLLVLTALTAPRCDMGVSFSGPSPTRAVVLVVALGETEIVPIPDDPDHGFFLMGDSSRTTLAHRFRVLQVAGGPEELLVGETLLAVPWQYDAGCEIERWSEPGWVAKGKEAVFTVAKTRLSQQGERITDQLGWHAPYPQAAFLEFEESRRPADRSQWLTPREYIGLLRVLPSYDSGRAAADHLAEIERVFADGDPRWSNAFPGREILRRTREWASSRGPF